MIGEIFDKIISIIGFIEKYWGMICFLIAISCTIAMALIDTLILKTQYLALLTLGITFPLGLIIYSLIEKNKSLLKELEYYKDEEDAEG